MAHSEVIEADGLPGSGELLALLLTADCVSASRGWRPKTTTDPESVPQPRRSRIQSLQADTGLLRLRAGVKRQNGCPA